MTTSLAIEVSLRHLEETLSRFFGFLPVKGRVGDHYTQDLEDLVARVLVTSSGNPPRVGADKVMTSGKWWTYYFTRNTIIPEVDRPKDIAARVAVGTSEERYVKIRVLPYSTTTLDYNLVSNDMKALEDLEESILLRLITLTQEFSVRIEGTDFYFKFQYKVLDSSLSYRVNPTQLGSLSVLSFPIEVRYPVFSLPEEVKIIKNIKFRIFVREGEKEHLYREIDVS